MRILGIDTSGYANAIGVIDSDRILADITFEARIDSLKKIVANIDFALKSAGLDLEDIQGFGIGLGPGSWTGIRVGVTVGKILAYSTGRPVSGVSTLEALAYDAGNRSPMVCPIISTGARDTVYAAFYHRTNGAPSRAGDYYVGDIKGLSERVKEPVTIAGPEARLYSGLITRALGSNIGIEAAEDALKGSAIARLASVNLERGDADDVLSLAPLYLKESTARAFQSKYSRRVPAQGQGT